MDPAKIANNMVKSVTSGEMVAIKSFWKDSRVLIIFLRRFGWQLCRLGAQQISQLKPQLDANKVKLVGVGLEELGLDEFVKGGFFKGELYLDQGKDCYKKLGFKRLNVFNMLPSLFGKKTRETLSKSKEEKIDGNFAGDGWQNGGTFVIDEAGKALLTFKQESPGEHVDPNEVLKALGIEGKVEPQEAEGATCDSDACAWTPPNKS